MRAHMLTIAIAALLLTALLAGCASQPAVPPPPPNPNAVIPGEFIVEPATLICFGFEWKIQGDANRNATVAVEYRKKGAEAWGIGMPLLRIGGETVNYRAYSGLDREYVTPHMFAGSIIDLTPDTDYECRLSMSDPDGAIGDTRRVVSLRTRAEPQPFEGGNVLNVYPTDYKTPRKQNEFIGLNAAYAKAQPGDTILMHAGLYRSQRLQYAEPLGNTFHGTYLMTRSGTPEKPIAIKAAGDGEVIFDGDGCYRLFDVLGASNLLFEGLTIRNTDVVFFAGLKHVIGCSGLTVKNCRMEDVGVAVQTDWAGAKNFYIADNVIIGRCDPWLPEDPYPYRSLGGPVHSYQAIVLYGQGHVVCHNRIERFLDGIDVDTYGAPEETQDQKAVAIDFYNNEIYTMNDDFVETDGGVHNIRVLRNRCVNSGTCGLSAQPIYGGPAYFIGNIMYNIPYAVAWKFEVRPAGLIVYHNTICSEWVDSQYASNVHFRNNLFLGTDSYKGCSIVRDEKENGRPLIGAGSHTAYSTMDYDGFRPNQTEAAQFQWKYNTSKEWRDIGGHPNNDIHHGVFKTLEEWTAATGLEKHAILVDYDIFENVEKPDWTLQPNTPYDPKALDFRLKPGCVAIDAGCVLTGVNDSFTGKAPDLGALEHGAPPPVYGPRSGTK